MKGGNGEVFFLKLDMVHLTTIKGSADKYIRREKRLGGMRHNAGVVIQAG